MWLLFHRKEGTKTVADGDSFVEECPTCEKRTRFVEVEISEKYGVWFVDVVKDVERAYRCTKCGDVFDLRDQLPSSASMDRTLPAAPAASTGMDRVEQLAAEQRKREEARAAIETKLDDELAELKRRMGR
ncbi:MAG TPA: hypothetical protein VIV11_06325 [Kofleriaceae bacterium]